MNNEIAQRHLMCRGQYIDEMSREELIEVIHYLVRQQEKDRKQSMEMLDTLISSAKR